MGQMTQLEDLPTNVASDDNSAHWSPQRRVERRVTVDEPSASTQEVGKRQYQLSHACTLARKLYADGFTDWWGLEILSVLLASSSFGTIIVILTFYDRKPLPNWPTQISMSSLLSVLAQLTQWGLMGSIASAIGQVKWIRYTRGQEPLRDFVAIDEAAKGPWGSLCFLITNWRM